MRYLLICIVVVSFCASSFAAEIQGVDGVASEQTTTFPRASEVVSRLANVSVFAENTKSQLEGLADTERIRTSLSKVLERQEGLELRIEDLGELSTWSFERLLENKNVIDNQNDSLNTIFNLLSDQLVVIDDLKVQWQQREKFWKEWQAYLIAEKEQFPNADITLSQQYIESILVNIGDSSGPLVSIQQEVRGIQERNQNLMRQIDSSLKNLRAQIFKKSALPLFSSKFYSQFNTDLKQSFNSNFSLVQWYRQSYVLDYLWVVLLQLFLCVSLALSLRRRRSAKSDNSKWNVLFLHPWACGFFVSFAVLGPLYKAPPLTWTFYLLSVSVVSVSILISEIVVTTRHKSLVWTLATIYLVSVFFKVISLPLPISRLYMVGLSVLGIPLLVSLCSYSRRNGEIWQLIFGIRCGIFLLLFSIIAQISGFSTLSFQLVDSSIETVFLVLMVVMVERLARGGVDYTLSHKKSRSFRFIRLFGEPLVARLNNIIRAGLYSYGVLYLGQIWGGNGNVTNTWIKLKNIGVYIGGVPLTVSTLIMVFVVMYFSLFLSWLTRSALDVEIVGPRYMDSGVRDSMKVLLHYMIISCGILFSLGAAGIGLQNFAVIAGALSIGIGFGLQNIVNNFISGLILLFERPVKIGDRIILDDEWAIVRKIGLRSTVIETYNQAEIIVPNSQLISEKVTNLTLTNTKARVVVDVGVAYGEDLDAVLTMLKEESEKHPLVLKYPEPSPLFVGFGDSSLNFKLRVWLANFDQGFQVQSELGVAIYRRFAEEGVTIPFPQRDLHINSIADDVIKKWQTSTIQSSKPPFPVEQENDTDADGKGDCTK